MVVVPTSAWGTAMMQLSSRRMRWTLSLWDGSGWNATTTSASRHTDCSTSSAFYSGDASYVLTEHGDGSATAAAAWVASGANLSGVCTLRPVEARLIDECTFTMSSGQLTSVDVLDPARGQEWQRTYDDGVRASIVVSPDGSAIPVPFPMGR
jgi:hypothetical protein